jgi:hypothetical protein
MMGYVPEQYLHSNGTPRTVFLTMTAVMLALASLATAYASVGHLYAISLLLGAAFGAHWSLLPAITRYAGLGGAVGAAIIMCSHASRFGCCLNHPTWLAAVNPTA